MPSIQNVATEKLRPLEQNDQLRRLKETHTHEGMVVERSGKKLISFSSNDYLGLSRHPKVVEAALEATKQHGTGAGASRLVTGNHALYEPLEKALAAWHPNAQAALVFGSGYLANIGLINALAGASDLIIADKKVHACMIDGAKLSSATLQRFVHNDLDSCAKLLKSHRKKHHQCFILTEFIFSMDGDAAPLEALYALALEHDATLIVDDAHHIALDENGKSTPLLGEAMILVGTCSKTLGSYGGYVCASQRVVDWLVNASRSLIFSTGLPPATIAASIAALEVIRAEPEVSRKLLQNCHQMREILNNNQAHYKQPVSAIFPLILGENAKALEASKALEEQGFLVSAIRPPTVAPNSARLRITVSALHSPEDISALGTSLKSLGLL